MRLVRPLLAVVLAASVLAGPATAQRKIEHTLIEDAVESAEVRFYMKSNTKGTAVVRGCPKCVPKRLKVTESMQVLDASGKAIAWDAGLNLGGKVADVFFTIESNEITRIVLQ